MKLFLDDIKKIDWLKQEIESQTWGKVFLNLPKGFYFVFNYDLVESESKIKVGSSKSLYEITEGLYRGLSAEHIGYMKDPFDTTNYLFFSLLKSACRTDEAISKLNELFFSYKVKDVQEAKANLKIRISGSQQVNSAISFNTALNNIFVNEKPIHGLCMIYELIDNYAKNVKGKSIYGQFLNKIVKAVKNPNGGLVPEYANTTMRYLIVGEKAAANNAEMMESLELAKKLHRSYNSSYSIYLETGWYFNKYDLKWRRRISDDTFYFQMDKISLNDGSFQYTPEGFKDLKNQVELLADGKIGIERLVSKGYDGRLSDYVSFEDAFNLYPNLRDIYSVFSVNVINSNYKFYFNPNPKSLVLISSKETNDRYDINRVRYVALHEIQHFIQNEEGFGNGGNPTFASLIDAVGGSSFRNFYNSLFAFQNKFAEVCITIPQEEFGDLIRQLRSIKLKVSLDRFANLCEDKQTIAYNTSTITFYLVSIYSLDDRSNSIIETFINKYFDSSYLELFRLSLQQNRKALDRNEHLTKKGWTEQDLYILNFQTYEALLGEVESRFVQQTSKIPKELQDYFELYTSETIDQSKISVYNDSAYIDEGKKAEAGIETTPENNYIIHLPEAFSNSINLLHETGHILYDFVKDSILSNVDLVTKSIEIDKDIEEYFCESFVDYVHRKDIDVALTRDISLNRKIKDYTDFDDIISSVLYYQSSIDENGLILRLGFVEKITTLLEKEVVVDVKYNTLIQKVPISQVIDGHNVHEVMTTKEIADILGMTTNNTYKYLMSLGEDKAYRYGYKVKGGWQDIEGEANPKAQSVGWQIYSDKL